VRGASADAMEYVVTLPVERLLCATALENVEHLVTVVHK